jgi:hypothetical protein
MVEQGERERLVVFLCEHNYCIRSKELASYKNSMYHSEQSNKFLVAQSKEVLNHSKIFICSHKVLYHGVVREDKLFWILMTYLHQVYYR